MMKRSKKVVNQIAAASLVLLPLFAFSQPDVEQKPNVLFILADDIGYTDLSCMGSKYYETPNIDRIAQTGMVFTSGYSTCQVCSPSRASILTGKFPARHGITSWIGEVSGEEWRTMNRQSKLLPAAYEHNLQAQHITLPEALKNAGYKTFFAGKWHLGEKGSWPEDHGFDINKGGWDVGAPKGGYFSPYENPNLQDGPKGENLEMRLARETVKFMVENKERPFFAYLSFYAVHGPIQTTNIKWKKYRDKAEKMNISAKGFAMARRLPYRLHQDNPVYAGLIESMDDAVGVVLDALKELNLDKNTIVIFTGDNGGVISGDSYSTNNAPLRGGKGSQWEGGIREPYFISVPWLNIGGVRSDVPVSGTDFYPTILDLVGLPLMPEQHNDGVSLFPLLNGGYLSERALIWHYPHYANQGGDPSSSIRKGNWKLIYYYEDDHEELYNLTTDFSETCDVSKENANIANQLKVELFQYLKEVGAKFPVKDPEYSSDAETKYLEDIAKSLLPQLEQERRNMLSKDFDPKNDWWGSKVLKD